MASTAPQQGRRWLSRQSTQNEAASSSESQQTSSQASNTSSDTRPRSLNNPQSLDSPSISQATAHASNLTSSQESSPPKEVRTCWICQQDDTEDTPENSIWRTPCPCSLTAHDSCLLEWIANEEAPKPGQLAQNRRIVCPQCQAEIKIQRPRDLLVSVVDNVHRAAKRMMLPAVVSATIGCAYSGLLVYGMNAMTLVFGSEETKEILMAGFHTSTDTILGYKRILRTLVQVTDPFLPAAENINPVLFVALPLIGPALVILRTNFADQYFPLLAPLYFIKPSHRTITWPPSPGLALATIPYMRTIYKELYHHAFSSLEKQWELAVQRKPREGETAEQIAAARAEAEDEDGHAILEIEWGEVEEVDIPPAAAIRAEIEAEIGENPRPFIQVPENPPPIDGAENEGVAPQLDPPNHGNGGRHAIERRVEDIDIPQIASTILGALFFPAISSIMGTLLKLTLPTHLTTSSIISRGGFFSPEIMSKGLLKEKWGRSIVGGCLFVVLKDAVVLYCKWKKARDFGKRRVLDFVGERGKTSR